MTTTDDLPVFARPGLGWFLLLDGGLVSLKLLALHKPTYDKVRETIPLPEQSELQRLLAGTAVVHVGEAIWAYRRAKRNGLGDAAGRWAVQTFVVGFPSLLAQRRLIRSRAGR